MSNKLFSVFFFFLLFLPNAVLAKHILVVESYHTNYHWDLEYKRALKDTLAEQHQLSYFAMDTKRIHKDQIPQKAELAWQEYLRLSPDLVILGDDNALKHLGPRLAKTKTPAVYLGINNNPRNYNILDASNITGVLERPLIKRSILTIKEVVPGAKRILLLFDSGVTSHTLIENIFNNETLTTISDIQLEIKLIEKFSLWQQEVEQAKVIGYDAIIVGLYHTLLDEYRKHLPEEQAMAWTAENSTLPLFALWDFAVGNNKTVGGLVISGYEQGLEAAKLTQKILAGTSPNQIRPISSTKGKYLFSQSSLEKYQLKLPDRLYLISQWVE